MKRILLASVASVFVIGNALAQQATPMPGMDMKGMDMMMMMMPSPNDPPSTKGYKSAMMKMMEAMLEAITLAGSADQVRQEVQELRRLATQAQAVEEAGS